MKSGMDDKSARPSRMKTTMRASVLYDVARIELRDVPRPEPGPYDVLVRVSAVGLCGTDFHIFSGHANYHTDPYGRPIPLSEQPQILGHEITGLVEEVGRHVKDLSAGDRVVLDQGLNCVSARRPKLCEYCATGYSHLCEFYQEHGITGLPGGLAEYLAIPAVNALRVTSDLESADASLTEPLCCIVHACDIAASMGARYRIGAEDRQRRVQTVLIGGAGPAGLIFVQYLRNVLGYDGLLLVSEPNARKRELAAQFGADVMDPQAVDLVQAVHEITKGRRVEYLIEASGVGEAVTRIPGLIRKQATVLLYGYGYAGTELSALNNIHFLEPTLVVPVGASGGFDADGRPSTYRRALRLIEAGQIDVASLITHRYAGLEAVPTAFAGDHRAREYVKGIVTL